MNDNRSTMNSVESEQPPRPTYAPVALALGVAMTTWGLLTFSLTTNSLSFMSFMGAGLVAWALWDWMREVALEWKAIDERSRE